MLKKQVLVLAVGVLALSVAACGGRAARPVAETSDLDARITCDGIRAEKEANVRRVAELADEKLANDIRNATKVVTFPLLGGVTTPLTFDLSLAIDEERRAIAKRDLRLDQLAVDKSCGGIVVELQGGHAHHCRSRVDRCPGSGASCATRARARVRCLGRRGDFWTGAVSSVSGSRRATGERSHA